ncbi:unnamed protein product, partial [Candidula unifasciata]
MIVACICALAAIVLCIVFLTREPELKAGVYRLPGRWGWLKRIIFCVVFHLRSAKKHTQKTASNREDASLSSRLTGYGKGHAYDEMEHPQPLSDSIDWIRFWCFVNRILCNILCQNHFCFIKTLNQKSQISWRCQELASSSINSPRFPVHRHRCKSFKRWTCLSLNFLEPMRRWKISYSGKLRAGMCNKIVDKPQEFVEANFSFTWTAFSQPFNFDTDMAGTLLGDSIAREQWGQDFFQRLKDNHQTHYEQWGELRGRLCLGNHEELLYLQCVRDHSF